MSTQVAGVLRDPFERPLGNTDIDIRAITNTFAVLPGATVKVTTSAQGEYNFILEPANYAVSVILDGRAVYQGAMTITSTTPPGTLPQLLKQAEMLSELPLNYAEYFQQVQATVKDDADRAQSAADGIEDQVDEARAYAQQSAASASSSEQSSQDAQQALADTQVIANKFQDLDQAVTETQQNAAQTSQDAQQTASDRAAADAAAQRAEDAAGSAETVNERSIRVPTSETINALPAASARANSFPSFDAAGQSQITPFNSVALLDAQGKVPLSNIPATVINETFPVASQAEMLALTAQQGDVANRTDINQSFILKSAPASTLANWIPLLGNPVFSVNSKTGQVLLGAVDISTAADASAGIISRTLEDIHGEMRSVKDFGAKGDNSADDTIAFKKAAAWASSRTFGATIFVPAGYYKVSDKISWDGGSSQVSWVGEGSGWCLINWIASSSDCGFSAGLSSPVQRIHLHGLTFATAKVTDKACITVFTTQTSPKNSTFIDVHGYGGAVGGTAANGYWAGGLVQLNYPVYPIFRDCHFYGIGGTPDVDKSNLIPSAYRIYSSNAKAVFFANFFNCFANNIGSGILLQTFGVPGIEGTFINSCNFNSCNIGVNATAESSGNNGYYPPQICIQNSQIEYLQRGIQINHHGKVTITGSLLYADPEKDVAIQHILLIDVESAIIQNNFMESRPVHTKCEGVQVTGASSNIQVKDNQIQIPSGHFGVIFAGTTRNSLQSGNIIIGGSEYVNSSSNAATNTAESYEGTDQSSYQTGKYIEKSGSVIASVDSTGVGTINYTKPFPNKIISLILTNGDSGNPGGASNGVEIQTSNQTGFVFKYEAAAAGTRRVNFIAKGR